MPYSTPFVPSCGGNTDEDMSKAHGLSITAGACSCLLLLTYKKLIPRMLLLQSDRRSNGRIY